VLDEGEVDVDIADRFGRDKANKFLVHFMMGYAFALLIVYCVFENECHHEDFGKNQENENKNALKNVLSKMSVTCRTGWNKGNILCCAAVYSTYSEYLLALEDSLG
jgi:hypothetical protein